jgi:P27 family predicted phage terminase small subunit
MAGPPRKPTVLKILQGNPGEKRINDREPQPVLVVAPPAPPAHIAVNADAKALYEKLTTLLMRNRLLGEEDLVLVESYCTTYARKRQAERFIQERGLFFPIFTEDGKRIRYLQQYPHVNIAERSEVLLMQMGDRLGLSPAARARLFVSKVDQTTSLAKQLLG